MSSTDDPPVECAGCNAAMPSRSSALEAGWLEDTAKNETTGRTFVNYLCTGCQQRAVGTR